MGGDDNTYRALASPEKIRGLTRTQRRNDKKARERKAAEYRAHVERLRSGDKEEIRHLARRHGLSDADLNALLAADKPHDEMQRLRAALLANILVGREEFNKGPGDTGAVTELMSAPGSD